MQELLAYALLAFGLAIILSDYIKQAYLILSVHYSFEDVYLHQSYTEALSGLGIGNKRP